MMSTVIEWFQQVIVEVLIVSFVLVCLCGISGLDFHILYTPWHFDDFEAFIGFDGLNLRATRFVSDNLTRIIGSTGEVGCYIITILMTVAILWLTIRFVIILFSLHLTRADSAAFTFAASALFFCIPFGAESFEYLGLHTNLLSYIFGISAAIIMIRFPASFWALVPVFLLIMLSAFAKEDIDRKSVV